MIQEIDNENRVILIVDKSTKFFRNAIEKFSKYSSDLVAETRPNMAFNNNQIKVANSLIELSFGIQIPS